MGNQRLSAAPVTGTHGHVSAMLAPRGATVTGLFRVLVVPSALLSTNVTFGLPLPETFALAFLFAGGAWLLIRGELRATRFLWFPLVLFAYGLFGLGFGDLVDSFRIVTAAAIALFALQLGVERTLPQSCRIVVYVLLALRLGSLVVPGPFVALYQVLGLRSAEIYGGGAAILFAEPSYLATAVLACWAIGRQDDATDARGFSLFDVAAIAVLVMSFSASAALYALIGTAIVIRSLKVIVLIGAGLLLMATSLLALQFNRLLVFVEAAMSIVQSGNLLTFVAIDQSAAWRLTSTVLAWTSAQEFPFGQFQLDLASVLTRAETNDTLGVVANNPLTYDFQRNLQGVTVTTQLLTFGGWPLLLAFLGLTVWTLYSLLRGSGNPRHRLLITAAIVLGVFLQSQLTSPFLYLCLAAALSSTIPANSPADGNAARTPSSR
jgi:hypothetical protein